MGICEHAFMALLQKGLTGIVTEGLQSLVMSAGICNS